jgi:hypothetical protein
MVEAPEVGQIIRMRSWHGIVLERFRSDAGKTVLRVQTVRNVFRNYPPELIEFDLAPDQVEPASREDLEGEIDWYRQTLERNISKLLNGQGDYNGKGY